MEAPSEDSPLFPGPGGGDARMSIRRYFKRAVLDAGLPYGRGCDEISFHSLRHTGASILANAGVHYKAIMEIGNWRDRRMVERYMHLGDDTLAAAMATLDRCVSEPGLSQSDLCHSTPAEAPEGATRQVTVN